MRRHSGASAALLLATTALGSSLLVGEVRAQNLPTGSSVAAGSVSIANTSATRLNITQSSQSAVVNWQSFSIGQGYSVNIQQPNSSSALLNRVTGDTPSTIAGSLTANGQVYLVNPNGIAITKSGVVNIGGGFVASTLGISDADFQSGKRTFTGNGASAPVSNAGTITVGRGGYAALIGGTVANAGSILVPFGKVGLGSGERVTLDFSGDGFLQVAMPTAAGGKGALVRNSGTIKADGGNVIISAATAREAARNAVNISGLVQARSIGGHSGAIQIGGGAGGHVKITGRLNATSRKNAGGSVTVTGQNIQLKGATVDVSGKTGGGTVNIGGGRQGQGPLQHADTVTVDKNTVIRADAWATGNGGNVTLWSDNATHFYGTILARGGALGGNGGEAEVSGKAKLDYTGFTDLSAATGRFGTLLLDPFNVTISTDTNNTGGSFVANTNDSIINASTLQTQLGSASVAVTTGFSGSQAGNITVAAPLTWSAATTLTLTAAGQVAINAPITITGAGGLAVTASALTNVTTTGLTFGNGAAVSYGTTNNGGNFSLNSASYTLVYSMSNLDSIDSLNAIDGSALTRFAGSGVSGRYALASDLVAAGTTYTSALIGSSSTAFSGQLEGLGHTITGLTISAGSTTYVGLVGQLNGSGATISNIGLVGGRVSGGDNTGALVGYNMQNGTVQTSYASTAVSGGAGVGGLVGRSFFTTVVQSSYATGLVSGSTRVGGLIGETNFGATTIMTYATGDVIGSSIEIGGLVGRNDSSNGIQNSYATGTVSGSGNVGGVAGFAGGTFTNAYWDITTSGIGTSQGSGSTSNASGVTGLTTTQLQGSLPTGFSTTAWVTGTGVYPYLKNFYPNGVQTITGVAYKDAGATPLASSASITATVSVMENGVSLGTANTSTKGAYSITVPAGTLTNGNSVLVYTSANGTTGATNAATITTSAGANAQSGVNILGNALTTLTTATTLSGAGSLAGAQSDATADANGSSAALAAIAGTTIRALISSGASFTIDQALTVAGGLIVQTTASNAPITVAQPVTGSGALGLSSTGDITFNTGADLTLTSGTVALSASGAIGLQNVSGGATLTLNATGNVTQAAGMTVQGSTALVKQGAGTLTLNAANTYTGTTTISAGTLNANASAALGDGSSTNTLILAGGTLQAGAAIVLPNTRGITLANTGVIDTNGFAVELAGVVGGSSGLTKSGSGMLTLSAVNTFTGTTTVNGGTLKLTGSGSIATSSTLALNGNPFDISAVTTGTTIKGLTGNSSSTVALGSNALTVSLAGSNSYAGSIGGTGTLTKLGTGTLTLSGTNTYTGLTTVTAGALTLSGGNAIVDTGAVSISASGTVNVSTNETIGSLAGVAGARVVLTSTRTLTTGDATNTTFAGVISGTSAALIKQGSGTFTLSGANTYTGLTTVSAGTLQLGAAGAGTNTPLGTVVAGTVVMSGAQLDLNGFSLATAEALTLNGTGPSNTGALINNSTTAATYKGLITLGSSSSIVASGGNIALTNTSTITGSGFGLTLGGTNAGSIASIIGTVAGTVTKEGTGNWTLTGANTYSGLTTVSAGTLVASNNLALGATTAGTTITSGATLQIASGIAIGAEPLTVSGAGVGGNGALIVASGSGSLGGAVTLGASASIGGSGNLTLGSAVDDQAAGTSTLTQTGSGTLTLSAAVGATRALAAVTTSSGQTIAINGGSVRTIGAQTYVGAMTTSGATTLTSTGGGDISATSTGNTFSGNLALSTSGAASVVNSAALAFGASSVGSLSAQTLAGDITLNGAITASGSGNAIVLALAGAFTNNAGSAALAVTGGGRWLVYSQSAGTDTFGGLDSTNTAVFGSTFAGLPPGSVTPSGNRYVFATTQTLTFTSTDTSKTYGDDGTVSLASHFSVSGFAAGVAGAFLGDSASTAFTGAPALTSSGTAAAATVLGGPYTITIAQGGLTSPSGYAFSFASSGRLTVNARAVTLTGTQVYDGSTDAPVANLTVSNLVSGDSLTLSGTGTLTAKNAGAQPLISSGGVLAGLTVDNVNYTVIGGSGSVTVNSRPVTLTGSQSYNGTTSVAAANLSVSNLVSGDNAGLSGTGTLTVKDAGARALTSSGGALAGLAVGNGNYTLAGGSGTVTVTPADVTVTALGGTSVYGSSPSNPGLSASGLQNGEGVDVLSGLSNSFGITTTSGVAGSPYTLSVAGMLSNGNYHVTGTNAGSWSVTPAALTITAGNQSKVYGTTAALGTIAFSSAGLLNSDAITGVTLTSSGSVATATVAGGPYAIPASSAQGTGLSNYMISYTNGQLAVTPAALTITAGNQSKVYGTTATLGTTAFSSAGLLNSDAITGVTLTSSGSVATATVAGGPYAIAAASAQGTGLSNYTIGYANGQLAVTPAALTVTATNQSKVYGTTAALGTIAFSSAGLLNSDAITGVTLTSSGSVATATVAGGPYAITASSAQGTGLSNYTISYANGQLAVTPAALTITAGNQSKVYGTTATLGTTAFSSAGLLNSDTVTGVTLTSSGSTATATVAGGPYAITASSAQGTGLSNYTISYANGQLAVTPTNIVVTALGGTSIEGSSPVNPGLSAIGLQNGEDISVLTGLSNSFGITSASSAGSSPYTLQVAGTSTNANYSVATRNSGTWTVTPAATTPRTAADTGPSASIIVPNTSTNNGSNAAFPMPLPGGVNTNGSGGGAFTSGNTGSNTGTFWKDPRFGP